MPADFSGALAHRAGFGRLGFVFRAGAGAGLARHAGRHANIHLATGERLREVDFHRLTDVGAGPGAPATAPPTHDVAEHLVEDAAQIALGEIEALRETAATVALLERRVAVTIVGAALLVVLQDVVRLIQFLEFGFGRGVARVAVRVVLHREFAVGAFQVVATRVLRHAQGGIVVLFRHLSPLSPGAFADPADRMTRHPLIRRRRFFSFARSRGSFAVPVRVSLRLDRDSRSEPPCLDWSRGQARG